MYVYYSSDPHASPCHRRLTLLTATFPITGAGKGRIRTLQMDVATNEGY